MSDEYVGETHAKLFFILIEKLQLFSESASLLCNWLSSKEVSLQINLVHLIGCPPDTEIFSKRRKIYSICVEGRDSSELATVNLRSSRSKQTGKS